MSWPLMAAEPDVGGIKPVIILIVVDFPAPFGPRNPRTSPSATEKDIPFTAWKPPKSFFRHFTSSIPVVLSEKWRILYHILLAN